MMFQSRAECEKIGARPGFSGRLEHHAVRIADTHTGELESTSRCFD